MFKLDKRLSAVSESIDTCNILADIGSDHGYLPIFMLLSKKINSAIVTDINAAPLASSIQNAEIYHVSEFCDFRCGSGLAPLKENECGVIAICGMGGDTIAKIISDDLSVAHSAEKIVLQPMTNQSALRKTLVDNGFEIIDEKMVKDRHLFYQVITAQNGTDNRYRNDLDYEFPVMLLKNKDTVFLQFLNYKLRIEEKILSNAGKMSEKSKEELTAKTENRIIYIKEMIRSYES